MNNKQNNESSAVCAEGECPLYDNPHKTCVECEHCGECAFFGKTIDGEKGNCGVDGCKLLQVATAEKDRARLFDDCTLKACPLAELPYGFGGTTIAMNGNSGTCIGAVGTVTIN